MRTPRDAHWCWLLKICSDQQVEAIHWGWLRKPQSLPLHAVGVGCLLSVPRHNNADGAYGYNIPGSGTNLSYSSHLVSNTRSLNEEFLAYLLVFELRELGELHIVQLRGASHVHGLHVSIRAFWNLPVNIRNCEYHVIWKEGICRDLLWLHNNIHKGLNLITFLHHLDNLAAADFRALQLRVAMPIHHHSVVCCWQQRCNITQRSLGHHPCRPEGNIERGLHDLTRLNRP
mmetsp:Transcript_26983/g.67998  ORF Transcript_26983/g.67998 Transcript_26983/m.67998 type:complete len:230 (-) Transcript_26983:451-1140(-)